MKNSEIANNIFAQPRQRLPALSGLIGDFHFVFRKLFINRRQGFQPLTGLFGNFYNSPNPDSGYQPCRRLNRDFNFFRKLFINRRQGFQPLTGLFGNFFNSPTPTAAASPVGG